MSTIVISSLCKKTFGSKLDATVLENGTHLIKYLEILLYTYIQKSPPT
jgi:hypothetical protein